MSNLLFYGANKSESMVVGHPMHAGTYTVPDVKVVSLKETPQSAEPPRLRRVEEMDDRIAVQAGQRISIEIPDKGPSLEYYLKFYPDSGSLNSSEGKAVANLVSGGQKTDEFFPNLERSDREYCFFILQPGENIFSSIGGQISITEQELPLLPKA